MELGEDFWVGADAVVVRGGGRLAFGGEVAIAVSLFLLYDFLASVSMSSGKETSLVTMSSSSPKVAAAALSAWPVAVLVGTCWLRLALLRGVNVVEVLPA